MISRHVLLFMQLEILSELNLCTRTAAVYLEVYVPMGEHVACMVAVMNGSYSKSYKLWFLMSISIQGLPGRCQFCMSSDDDFPIGTPTTSARDMYRYNFKG